MPAISLPLPLTFRPVSPCSADDLVPCARSVPALYDYLAQVPDPRDPRGLRHPLPALLGQVSCALLCGARSLTAVADWGRDYAGPLVATLGYTRAGTPCGATFHAVLQDLDWSALEAQLRAWAQAGEDCLGAATPAAPEEALALDGKTLRGALKMGADVTALVTALGHRFGLTVGAVEVVDGDERVPHTPCVTGIGHLPQVGDERRQSRKEGLPRPLRQRAYDPATERSGARGGRTDRGGNDQDEFPFVVSTTNRRSLPPFRIPILAVAPTPPRASPRLSKEPWP